VAAPPYHDEILRSVAEDVRATLAGELGDQPLAALIDEVFALNDTLVAALDAKDPEPLRRLPVCRPGCDSCCRLHVVFVTPAEALRIADHVRATRTPAEVEALIAALREVAPRVAEMTVKERAEARVPCPLLDAHGACSVHPARPLLCRAYNSCDVAACLTAFGAGDPETKLVSNLNQAVVGKTLFAALVLGGGVGRDLGPLELIHGVLTALTAEDATERWLRGEPVFSPEQARVSREAAEGWEVFVAREASRK